MTLFRLPPGAVVAPAGCGKTQTIVDALAAHDGPPVLVLTHTNAGVTALRSRLANARAPSERFRLATIDGWALKLISIYPRLAGHRNDDGRIDYPSTQDAAVAILEGGALSSVLRATYGRVVVDEYQDCSARQHRLVTALAAELPCHVLGDPLQCIFDFNGEHPDWTADVLRVFAPVMELEVPHRWINAGQPEFGQWVLACREPLLRGARIDLEAAPANVTWRQLPADAAERRAAQAEAAAAIPVQPGEKLLILGDARPVRTRLEFARANAGVQVVEPVDLADMVAAAAQIGAAAGIDRLRAVLDFVRLTMSGVAPAFAERFNVLRRGGDGDPPDVAERAALRLGAGGGLVDVKDMLVALRARRPHIHRPHLLAVMIAAVSRAVARDVPLLQAAVAEREAQRTKGRDLPVRGIGSTLLMKGLEGAHSIILNADPMTPQHLYVALSRASTSLTVLSSDRALP